jgi:hypothetical protein
LWSGNEECRGGYDREVRESDSPSLLQFFSLMSASYRAKTLALPTNHKNQKEFHNAGKRHLQLWKRRKREEKHTDSNTGKNKITVEIIMFVLF